MQRDNSDIGESTLSAESTTHAWQLRKRASDHEKFFIDASYEILVTGNLEKAQRTCDAWRESYPRDKNPYGFLAGMIYPVLGRFDDAVQRSNQAIQYDPDLAYEYNVLALSDIALNRLDEAKQALQRASDRNLQIPDMLVDRYQIAFLEGDRAEMERVDARG